MYIFHFSKFPIKFLKSSQANEIKLTNAKKQSWYLNFGLPFIMVVRVVEFSFRGYKIGKIFA